MRRGTQVQDAFCYLPQSASAVSLSQYGRVHVIAYIPANSESALLLMFLLMLVPPGFTVAIIWIEGGKIGRAHV